MTIQMISEGRYGVATLTAQTVNGPVTIDLRPNRNTRNNIARQNTSKARFITLPGGIQQRQF